MYSVARRSYKPLAWEVVLVVLVEMHHRRADPASHLLLEKALVISHATYLQIACPHVGSSKVFLSYVVTTELVQKGSLELFQGRVSLRTNQLEVFASDTRL